MRTGRSAILRLFQLFFLTLGFLFGFLFSKKDRPQRLRLFLQRVSGLPIKIGQIIAMRVDFLPPEYVQELIKLLDEVPPFPSDRSRRIVEEELGAPISELFATFEETPMASASFAQVHAATLHSGQEVVVKVQRPGVADRMVADLKIFRALAFLVDLTGLTRRTPLKPVYREFEEWTHEELDFRIEGSHVQEIYDKAKDSPTEKIPKVYWAYTTPLVLTLERLRGTWVKEIMQLLDTDLEAAKARLTSHNTSFREVSQNLLRNTLRQIFEYGVYHSDPHAGNLMVMDDGRIGYVDFGITGRIGRKARQQQVNIHIALESGDFETFFTAMVDTIEAPYLADLDAFKRDLAKNYKIWLRAQFMGSRNTQDKSFARLMLSINNAAQKAGIGFRSMEVRIFRTLATVDAILLDFAPNLDVRAEFRQFFTHYNLKTLAHEDIPLAFQRLPAVIRKELDERFELEVVQVVPRVSKVRRFFSRALAVLAVLLAAAGVLLLIRPDLLGRTGVGPVAAGIGIVAGILFCVWLSHLLYLKSVVRDRVILPRKERR